MKVIIEKTADNFYLKLECPSSMRLSDIDDLWKRLSGDGLESSGVTIRTKPVRPILTGSAARKIPVYN